MKTISFVSHWVLAAAACLACSGGPTSVNGSLESTLSASPRCGGNIANAPQCPDGFECVPDPDSHLPFGDVGGICQLASEDPAGGDAPQRCGGNIANAPTCPDGFDCVPDPDSHLPFGDVGGICQLAAEGGSSGHGCGSDGTRD